MGDRGAALGVRQGGGHGGPEEGVEERRGLQGELAGEGVRQKQAEEGSAGSGAQRRWP